MMRFDDRRITRRAVVYVFAVFGAAFVIYSGIAGLFGEMAVPTVLGQTQDPFLSRRVDALEQRLYGIESRISRVEQDVRSFSSRPTLIPGNNDAEIRLLRSEVDNLRLRLGEAECGLVRIDERTLTPPTRLVRSKAAPGKSDICRQDRDLPLQLSARP